MQNIQCTGKLYNETITVKQISKVAAKKLFAQGIEIYLQSSNMHAFGIWQSLCPIKLDFEQLQADIKHNDFCINLYSEQTLKCSNVFAEYWEKSMLADYENKVNTYKANVIDSNTQFTSIINNYRYYNCDSERGNYIHFYAKL